MVLIVYLLHLKENAINLLMKENVIKDMMDFVFGLQILVNYGISVHKQFLNQIVNVVISVVIGQKH